MSTCPHCRSSTIITTTKRQQLLVDLQKETKFWKERYYMEKKSLSCLVQWVLGVFGFTVKVELDKDSLGIRIEGRENKEAMALAVIPTADNKVTLLMEDRLTSEDFIEDSEEMAGLALALAAEVMEDDVQVGAGDQNDQNEDQVSQDQGEEVEMSAGGGESVDIQQQRDAQAILDILRNYEDSGGHQSSSYIIIKDGNEAIPVQLDCTQFLNGEFSEEGGAHKNSTIVLPDNQQIVYRLASSSGALNANTELTLVPSPNKKTLPSNTKGNSQEQSQRYSPPVKKTKVVGTGQSSTTTTPSSAVSKAKPSSSSTNSTASSDTVGGKIGVGDKLSADFGLTLRDFGLTLREKAEVYVQTKAMEVIHKTSQGSYTCSECSFGYTFTSVENALTHTKTHFEGKPYKCHHCEETFAIQKDYLQHRKHHYSKKSSSKTSILLSSTPTPTKALASPVVTTKQNVFLPPPSRSANTVIPSTSKVNEPASASPSSNKSLLPGPGNKNKQFQCKVPGCEWSYPTANELGWHMKAHSQSRV